MWMTAEQLEVEGTRGMRVLHIIGTLHPAAGGPSEAVKLLLRDAARYNGEVVTLDPPDASFIHQSFPVHALGPVGTKFGYTPRLRRWLRAHRDRFDAVVVHGLWNFAGKAVYQEFAGNKPYFVFPHGMLDPYFKRRHPLKHLKKLAYWTLVERDMLRRASAVLFTSETEARLARQTFPLHRWNALVVPYGAGPPLPPSAEMLKAFFAVCPDVREKRFLLHLGRIHAKKGCDLLLRAFAKAAQQDPALHLVMAGPDQTGWAKKLKALAEEVGVSHKVHWTGLITGAAKWGALYAAEAFVLPSHQENFGIAVAEALGCSTPVLLSDKVNIADDIANDGAGLVEPDTQTGTDRLLQRWLDLSLEQRRALALQAQRTFLNRYSMDRAGQTILSAAAECARVNAKKQEGSVRGRLRAGLPARAAASHPA